jgi:dTDP-4-amino-4,6-dideoxygalactose transaminase
LNAAHDELSEAIRRRLDVKYCAFTSTGRAALTVVLKALRSLAPAHRTEVMVPSYTCFSVPASIVKAGLRPRIVDVDPGTLDFDEEALAREPHEHVLAVVATSLYGLPANLPRLSRFARERQLFLIDDAAQALGASIGGRPCGSWGDAGVLSFDKGKNLTAIDGGAITTSSGEVADAINAIVSRLPHRHARERVEHTLKLAAYCTLLHPRLYWIPNGLPFLGLGETVYRTDFPLEVMSRAVATLAATMWPRLETFRAARRRNGAMLREMLRAADQVTLPAPLAGASTADLRFPLLVRDPGVRAPMIAGLRRMGIGATASYPSSVADVPGLRGCWRGSEPRGGRAVAATIVTLPTHPYVTSHDVKRMADYIQRFAPNLRLPLAG